MQFAQLQISTWEVWHLDIFLSWKKYCVTKYEFNAVLVLHYMTVSVELKQISLSFPFPSLTTAADVCTKCLDPGLWKNSIYIVSGFSLFAGIAAKNLHSPILTEDNVEDVNFAKSTSILPITAPHAGKLKIAWILRKYACISCKFTILHNYYLHYYHPGNISSCKFTILQFTILQIYRLANLLSCKFTILDIYYLANGSLGKNLSWNFTILESNHLGKFVLESMTCNNESW